MATARGAVGQVVGLVVVAASCCLALPIAARTGIGEVCGPLRSCAISDARVVLEVQGDKLVRVEIARRALLPWPSDAYRAAVGEAFAMAGACPANGEQVRVTHCTECTEPRVVSVETGGRGTAFDEAARQLWLLRQWYDLQSARSNESVNLFAASIIVAKHNRKDQGRRTLWIRDRLGRQLDAYRTRDRADYMIAKFGRPELRPATAMLRAIYDEYGDRIGLIRGLPYLPADPRSSPFVGAWGTFAVEVYLEASDGALSRLDAR